MIEFTCRHPGHYVVRIELEDDAPLEHVVEAFEQFLVAAGYHPDNVKSIMGGEP